MRIATKHHPLLLKLGQVHWRLIGIISLLACFGFAMMLSAAGGSLFPWAMPQVIKFCIAFVLMIGIALVPPRDLLQNAYWFYALCLTVLVAVALTGSMGKGAQRWVDVGLFNLQPSELMKVALILALARYFHNLHQENTQRLLFLLPPALLILVPALLILRQPNLGTTLILLAVGGIMFFMAGVRLRYFAAIIAATLAATPVLWHFLHDYQKQRILTFLDPQADPLGAGYNIMQSIIAIGSGGFFGKGYMEGSQGQLNFLPEKHTDFIFTMVAEEFGFLGSILVLTAYGAVLAYGMAISLRCRHRFGNLLAIGVVAMLFVHITINAGMVMGILPVVGVPLPLLSYGGSIMMTMLMAFGLMLNSYVWRDDMLSRGGGTGFE